MNKLMVVGALFLYLFGGSRVDAGGSAGGGSGSGLILQLELFSEDITRDQFSALVLSVAEDRVVLVNGSPAKVRAEDFKAKTGEIEIQGTELQAVLKTQENLPTGKID